jgi:hypothetical protein
MGKGREMAEKAETIASNDSKEEEDGGAGAFASYLVNNRSDHLC